MPGIRRVHCRLLRRALHALAVHLLETGSEARPEVGALTVAYYRTCDNCGANLDPGEICRCKKKEAAQLAPGTASDRNNDHASIVSPDPAQVKAAIRDANLSRTIRDLEAMGVKIPGGG